MKKDETLVKDVKEIKLAVHKSKEKRIREYIHQTGNPYRVRVGGIVVDMEYTKGGRSLQALMEETTLLENPDESERRTRQNQEPAL